MLSSLSFSDPLERNKAQWSQEQAGGKKNLRHSASSQEKFYGLINFSLYFQSHYLQYPTDTSALEEIDLL